MMRAFHDLFSKVEINSDDKKRESFRLRIFGMVFGMNQ